MAIEALLHRVHAASNTRDASRSKIEELAGTHKSEGREWGVGSVVLGSAFLLCPDFHTRCPKFLFWKGFERLRAEVWGVPKADPATTDPTPLSRPSEHRRTAQRRGRKGEVKGKQAQQKETSLRGCV